MVGEAADVDEVEAIRGGYPGGGLLKSGISSPILIPNSFSNLSSNDGLFGEF